MKILQLHNRYAGGYGGEDSTVALEYALLRDHGHSVTQLQWHNANAAGSVLGTLATGLGMPFNWAAYRQTVAAIQQHQPDVLHVHNLFIAASPAVLWAAARTRVPVVMTLHNYRLVCANGLFLRDGQHCTLCANQRLGLSAIRYSCYRGSAVQSLALTATTRLHHFLGTWQQRVDAYIASTNHMQQQLQATYLNIPTEKFFVKPHFAADWGLGAEPRQPYYCYIGRLSEEKGILHVLQAAQRLPHIAFKVIGGGPLQAQVQAAASTLPNLHYLGYVPEDVLIATLQQARALIFPSIATSVDTFGYTLIEAFSTGTPVIAPHMGHIHEIVEHLQQGLIYDLGSVDALCQAILRFEQGGPTIAAMYTATRQHYLAHFSPLPNYQRLMHIYEQVIANKKASRG